MSESKLMVWCDLETTGLSPDKDSLLEAAFVITDRKYKEVTRYETVFPLPEVTLNSVAPVVFKMHTENGLWEACSAQTKEAKEISAEIYDWLTANLSKDDSGVSPPLAGNTVHFDRAFLKVHLGDVESRLHYRNFDVSTLKWFCINNEIFTKDQLKGVEGGDRHRAMDDVLQALSLANWMQKNLKKAS